MNGSHVGGAYEEDAYEGIVCHAAIKAHLVFCHLFQFAQFCKPASYQSDAPVCAFFIAVSRDFVHAIRLGRCGNMQSRFFVQNGQWAHRYIVIHAEFARFYE